MKYKNPGGGVQGFPGHKSLETTPRPILDDCQRRKQVLGWDETHVRESCCIPLVFCQSAVVMGFDGRSTHLKHSPDVSQTMLLQGLQKN